MNEREGWRICASLYDPDTDSVLLMSEDGQVLARIPRNRVIEMISLLPPNPPELKNDSR